MNTQIKTLTIPSPRITLSGFRRPTPADIPMIQRHMALSGSRACDFTVGGLMLWVDFFNYWIQEDPATDTLIIRGDSTDGAVTDAFWIPLGEATSQEYADMLRTLTPHPVLTAVPEELVDRYASIPGARVSEMPDFADYIYRAEALATFSGKKLGKKRNHVNRFTAMHPGYTLEPITPANIDEVRRFYARMTHKDDSPSARYEAAMVSRLLDNFGSYPFIGAALITPDCGIVAFTVGEVCGDTLHVHIEKMNHTVDGSGETICHLFAASVCAEHPEVQWINRQDDAGDPGLRRAKQSYAPAALLRKYNVCF